MKKNLQARAKPWLVCVLLAAFSVLLIGGARVTNNRDEPDLRAQMARLQDSLNTRMLPTDRWHTDSFKKWVLPDGNANPLAEQFATASWLACRQRLPLYRQLPEINEIIRLFDESLPGIAVSRRDFPLFNPLGLPLTQDSADQRLKIVFYGYAQLETDFPEIKGLVYLPEWKSIMFPAKVFENPVLIDAMLVHELRHVAQYRSYQSFGSYLPVMSAPDGRLTDIAADNEVDAHRLSGQVFDIGTNGEYYKRIRAVVASKPEASDEEAFLLKIRAKDLVYLDEPLGRPSGNEAGLRRYQYLYDLGREWIDSHVLKPERPLAMRSFFKLLQSSQPGKPKT